MKCTLKFATIAWMLGTTVATAQTHPFVERYREMQTLVTANPYVKAVFRYALHMGRPAGAP
jgi:hypothetical protein